MSQLSTISLRNKHTYRSKHQYLSYLHCFIKIIQIWNYWKCHGGLRQVFKMMLSRWRSHWMVKFMIANQKTSSKRQFKIFPDFCRLDIGPTKVSSCTFMVLSWKSTRMTSFELALHLRLLPKDTSVMSRLYLYGPRWMWTDQSRLWIWFYFLRRIKLDDLIPELAVLFDIRTKNASLMSIVSHNLWVMHYSGSETCFRGDMFQKVELKLSTVLILHWYRIDVQGSSWQSTTTVPFPNFKSRQGS